MKTLKQYPFIAFIAIAGLLFMVEAVYQHRLDKADYIIELSQSDIERLATLYAKQQKRAVSEEDLKQLIRVYVEERALAREAEKLNLGDDDTIIRRRLVQKIKFIMEDNYEDLSVTKDELRGYYEANKTSFAQPMKVSFEHVFVSPKEREDIFKDALNIQQQLNTGTDWHTLGDPFMLDKSYKDVTSDELAQLFGINFASKIAHYENEKNFFGHPLGSAYGVHLVRITKRTEAQIRTFNEVKDAVLISYKNALRERTNNQAIAEIVNKYEVVFVDDNE